MHGSVCKMAASQYDIFPTILELADCSYKMDSMQPGRSLVPYMHCPAKLPDRDVVIFDEYGKTRMIKKDGYKYVHHYEADFNELYYLAEDPDEMENLWGREEYEVQINAMKQEMEEWFARYSLPIYDGIQHDVTGRGQKNLCDKKDAFDQSFTYVKNRSAN